MAKRRHSLLRFKYAMGSVIAKEWLDLTRDIKGILPVLLMPVLFALTSLGALHFIVSTQKQAPSFTLAVSNAHLAAPLIQQLNESGIATEVLKVTTLSPPLKTAINPSFCTSPIISMTHFVNKKRRTSSWFGIYLAPIYKRRPTA